MLGQGERILLWDQLSMELRGEGTGPFCDAEDFIPFIDLHLIPGDRQRPLVLICPGGGYGSRTGKRERSELAFWLNGIGLHAAVLHYRLKPWRYPAALLDGRRALQVIVEHAEEWRVARRQIGVLGCSAGGHLAGCLALVDDPIPAGSVDAAPIPCFRPSSLLMAYPVVSLSHACAHESSARNLLGDHADPELRRQLSLEHRVDDNAPPLFVWHCQGDALVLPENTTLLAEAYARKGRPCREYIFPGGGHGQPKASGASCVGAPQWRELAKKWYDSICPGLKNFN